ncbi:SHOCT domain-containing protein [Candidatus Woesearchaeota archaeon]|nr:SHOCT domain-containing protein [Candidatus Woesearchaeota archaeon]
MMHEYMHGSVGWFSQLLILVFFFLIIYWLLRCNTFGFHSDESASDILKKRLAKGEISRSEYLRLKKEVGNGD